MKFKVPDAVSKVNEHLDDIKDAAERVGLASDAAVKTLVVVSVVSITALVLSTIALITARRA